MVRKRISKNKNINPGNEDDDDVQNNANEGRIFPKNQNTRKPIKSRPRYSPEKINPQTYKNINKLEAYAPRHQKNNSNNAQYMGRERPQKNRNFRIPRFNEYTPDNSKISSHSTKSASTNKNIFNLKHSVSKDEVQNSNVTDLMSVYVPKPLAFEDDVKSDSFSINSANENVEIKILNVIHDFKTILHCIDTNPSSLVLTEIKQFGNYIELFCNKWGIPNDNDSESNSDCKGPDEDHFINKMKVENIIMPKIEKSNGENSKSSDVNYLVAEPWNSGITPFENSLILSEFEHKHKSINDANTESNNPAVMKDDGNTYNENLNEKQEIVKEIDLNKILKEIQLSNVTLSFNDIELIKTNLEKISMLSPEHLNLSKVSEYLNACLIALIPNETIPLNVKIKILGLLEKFLLLFTDETSYPIVEDILSEYRKKLDSFKSEETKINLNNVIPSVVMKKKEHESLFLLNQFKELILDEVNTGQSVIMSDPFDESSVHKSDTSNEENNNSESEEGSDGKIGNPEESNGKKIVSKRKIKYTKGMNVRSEIFLDSPTSIKQQVDYLLKVFKLSKETKKIEKGVLSDIKRVISDTYPKSKLYIFGSRTSNMALPDSDIDIYIDLNGNSYSKGTDYEAQQLYVKKVRNLFYRHQSQFSDVCSLTRTTVPIIKIHHKNTLLNCDISFKNGMSVENTKLLNYYLDIDPRVRWLIAAIKLWAQYNEINGSNYFTSHALNWMVLFFLMKKKIVPPVLNLKGGPPNIISGWDVSFTPLKDWVPENSSETYHLFKDFFDFIYHTDWTTFIMCTLTGELLYKKYVEDTGWLRTYKNGVFAKWIHKVDANQELNICLKEAPSFNLLKVIENGLCIQDPIEYCRNVSTQVHSDKFEHFIHLCYTTLNIMNNFVES